MSRWRIAVLAAVAAIVALVVFANVDRGSHETGGESWVRGRGYGHAIILRRDGTYVAYTVCDICNRDDEIEGTWSRSAGRVTLVREKERVILDEIEFGKCKGIAVLDSAGATGMLKLKDVYFREGDPCPAKL